MAKKSEAVNLEETQTAQDETVKQSKSKKVEEQQEIDNHATEEFSENVDNDVITEEDFTEVETVSVDTVLEDAEKTRAELDETVQNENYMLESVAKIEETDEAAPKKRGRKSKQEDETINLDRIYEKRRIHRASDEERKDLYKSDHVVPLVGETFVDTETAKIKEEYRRLAHAAGPGVPVVCQGKITGIITTPNGIIMATVSLNDSPGYFQIRIPSSQLFLYNQPDCEKYDRDEKGQEDLKRAMIARIGAPIEFLVYHVDEANKVAYASRLMAMQFLAHQYFEKLQGNGEPILRAGLKANAVVTETRRGYVKVAFGGAECIIRAEELDYNRIQEVNEQYQTGDTFPILILSAEMREYTMEDGKKIKLPYVQASRKQAIPTPWSKYAHLFNEGNIYVGTATLIHEGGVYVLLDSKLECKCARPAFAMVTRGKTCTVVIAEKDEENQELRGTIMRVNS